MDADREVLGSCVELLGKFIGVKEPNIRYLGLVRHAGPAYTHSFPHARGAL